MDKDKHVTTNMSPLTRGAWIEISVIVKSSTKSASRPSHEGRGLKLQATIAISQKAIVVPRMGGRGLKYYRQVYTVRGLDRPLV